MKNLMIILLCTLFSITLSANHIGEQPIHNVVAKSGLTMRMLPGTEHAAIKIIPFGEQVLIIESSENPDRIDWIDGNWVLVAHDGDTGYVFDGFLSELAIPFYDFEVSQFGLDLIYPLESYAEYRLVAEGQPDTIHRGEVVKVIHRFEGGEKLVRSDNEDYYKVQLYLNDIRVMDAYHLVQNMLREKKDIKTFQNQSVFIQNKQGEIDHVRVKLDHPVYIKKLKNGQVRISILSSESGC